MNSDLKNYKYSKQYILLEKETNVILKNLKDNSKVIDNTDYQWKIVTSVTQKNYNGEMYDFIQLDDQKVGWIKLEDSIQIFRFNPRTFKLIEDKYYSDEINMKLDFEKDFYSAFEGKLLTIKSEIDYNDKKYYGVFIKDKFQGFHPSSYLDEAVEYNLYFDKGNLKNSQELFTVSSLSGQIKEKIDINTVKLVLLFHIKKLAKLQINDKEMYWTSFSNIENITEILSQSDDTFEKSKEDKLIEDILYSVDIERNKTKKIIKSVISAKEFINLNKDKKDYMNFPEEDEIKLLKDALKLSEERLASQKNFSNRLTEQKDRYKARMVLVEEKLKVLDEKYKALKNK
ncbi:hypothetical protein E4T89_02295 [Jeotgalicoccus nanhaiensis]|uniref:GW domain-containing protein n=1 Tax=Jeotgalicoccus nanhaiensis TaxID=568603 RepID=A0ABR9XW27_9STAP|nr:hypothetical protein [Jeotgalicoccus nanhaiensis]MBF0753087.1 hypothetical protein [Jeotgalicoccus nanhaiensis]TFU62260.1 hypothetical protein E4T89_02295 [Jeotgalicoccus nanhaiensis]